MTGDGGRRSLLAAKVMVAEEDSGGNVDEPMSREVNKSLSIVNGMSNLQRLYFFYVILVIVTPRL